MLVSLRLQRPAYQRQRNSAPGAQGKTGPITILLMPDEMISETKTLDGESVHGYIVPVGNGSIAIIGTREEELDEVQQKVVNSVAWGV